LAALAVCLTLAAGFCVALVRVARLAVGFALLSVITGPFWFVFLESLAVQGVDLLVAGAAGVYLTKTRASNIASAWGGSPHALLKSASPLRRHPVPLKSP
jgi:hypothetical protein